MTVTTHIASDCSCMFFHSLCPSVYACACKIKVLVYKPITNICAAFVFCPRAVANIHVSCYLPYMKLCLLRRSLVHSTEQHTPRSAENMCTRAYIHCTRTTHTTEVQFCARKHGSLHSQGRPKVFISIAHPDSWCSDRFSCLFLRQKAKHWVRC